MSTLTTQEDKENRHIETKNKLKSPVDSSCSSVLGISSKTNKILFVSEKEDNHKDKVLIHLFVFVILYDICVNTFNNHFYAISTYYDLPSSCDGSYSPVQCIS